MRWHELYLPPINLYNIPRKDSDGASTRKSSSTFCGN